MTSPFCAITTPPEGASEGTKSNLACLDTAKCIHDAITKNEEENKKYDDAYKIYQAYLVALDHWTHKNNEYSEWATKENALRDEKFVWDKCALHEDAYKNVHHDWCDTGDCNKDSNLCYHSLADNTNGGCSAGLTKGVCKRTDYRIKRDLDNAGYLNAKPSYVPAPEQATLQNVSGMTISCCNNSIDLTNSSAKDNIQTCIQDISSKESVAIGVIDGKKADAKKVKEKQDQIDQNNMIFYIIVSIIVVIALSCMSSIAVIF